MDSFQPVDAAGIGLSGYHIVGSEQHINGVTSSNGSPCNVPADQEIGLDCKSALTPSHSTDQGDRISMTGL